MTSNAPAGTVAKKLVVQLGGTGAASMLARQGVEGLNVRTVDLPGGEIAYATDKALESDFHGCVFVGTPINGPNPRHIHNAEQAVRYLPEADGAFLAVCWDKAACKLVVVSDFLGMQPVYMRRRGPEITLATETKAFEARPDIAGWGAFVSMGHTVGKHTLLEGVQRLPPATLLVYDATTGDLHANRYWQWSNEAPLGTPHAVVNALRDSVKAYSQAYGEQARLMLSGGFDSRLLLHVLLECGVRPEALIVSHADEAGDADGQLGRLLARREGIDFEFIRPRKDFFSSAEFLDYVDDCDAAVPTMSLFIAKLAEHIRGGAVWDGLVPGFALRLVFNPGGGFDGYLRDKCNGWESKRWRAARVVFGEKTARAMFEGFQKALQEEVARFSDDDTGIFRFIAENRIRHRTSSTPLKVLGLRTQPYVPGMTKAFFSLIANLPRDQPGRNEFYMRIFRECFPRSLDIPFVKGGQLIRTNGGNWHYRWHRAIQLRERFLAMHPSLDPKRHLARFQHGDRRALSRFLHADDALLESDGWTNIDAISAICRDDPSYVAVRTVLFHWKAWQWVHQRRLREALAPCQ